MTAPPPKAPDLDPAWSPALGDRVTLLYTEEFCGISKFPRKRVGEVSHLHASGCFSVSVKPQRHTVYVDPENYAQHGCSFREWRIKDGWPVERVTIADLRRKEKKKR